MLSLPRDGNKVHDWLIQQPDPPRQSRGGLSSSPKQKLFEAPSSPLSSSSSSSSPEHNLKVMSSSHEPSYVIHAAAETEKSTEHDIDQLEITTLDNNNNNNNNNDDDDNDKHEQTDDRLTLLHDDEQTKPAQDTPTHKDNSTAVWEDAAVLLLCTIHWLTIMAMACFVAGLIIVWKTGYRLGLDSGRRKRLAKERSEYYGPDGHKSMDEETWRAEMSCPELWPSLK